MSYSIHIKSKLFLLLVFLENDQLRFASFKTRFLLYLLKTFTIAASRTVTIFSITRTYPNSPYFKSEKYFFSFPTTPQTGRYEIYLILYNSQKYHTKVALGIPYFIRVEL